MHVHNPDAREFRSGSRAAISTPTLVLVPHLPDAHAGLLALASRLVAAAEACGALVSVSIHADKLHTEMRTGPHVKPPTEGQPLALPVDPLDPESQLDFLKQTWLHEDEHQIVKLACRQPVTGFTAARQVGRGLTTVKLMLSGLVGRGVLKNDHTGYGPSCLAVRQILRNLDTKETA
jgi:hypothetical protein